MVPGCGRDLARDVFCPARCVETSCSILTHNTTENCERETDWGEREVGKGEEGWGEKGTERN